MVKLNNLIFAFVAVIISFVAAASVTDEKHCAPRACCGCPNGKPIVKALMYVFLDKISANERSDAYKLLKTGATACIDVNMSDSCTYDCGAVDQYFDEYFPVGSIFINTDFEYVMLHDGSIQVKLLTVVTKPNRATRAYDIVYTWVVDAQCNWHISAIRSMDVACRLDV